MMESQRPLRETPDLSWRVLGLLNVFRLLAPVVLGLVFAVGGQPHLVGETHQGLFRGACVGYFVTALVLIAVLKRRQRTTAWHAYVPAIIDVAALSLIVYASGGAESGLAIALFVPVAAVSVLVDTRGALMLAAAATLTLLALQLLSWAEGAASPVGFAQAGYYGAILFLAAGGGTSMARRLRETEAVVRQRDIDVANLAELSEYIVQHLRESIVVVDAADRVRLINESARQLLGPEARPGALLGEISPRLLYHIESWRRTGGASLTDATLVAADGGHEFQAHFAALGRDFPVPVIAFLSDTSELAERVQQTKLAALGRLSASIAHEIRNPVGAMSHAAQLLAEAAAIRPEERRLTEIITGNAERVSSIIANVLQLSRRESTRPERVAIGEWLAQFQTEFCETLQLPTAQLRSRLPQPDIAVRIDPTHLRQIVWNLCENATRHSADMPGNPPLDLMVARLQASGRPFLEVADRGPGIPDSATERIFEPFFTGRRGGTGLGLFIARELAQCNGALLLYEPRAGGGSIFRVVFADPQRWGGRTDA
jgi:two-component system, NtrC family, sensor histidine kinase PilS